MFKKDACNNYTVEVGEKVITTMVATSSTVNKILPTNNQPANTKVKLVITSYDMNGVEIKSKTTNVVTLP